MRSQKHLFSLPDDVHYLNCATMSPNLKAVERAGIEGILRKSVPHQITSAHFFETTAAVKPLFARLIGCPDPERIAVIPSVSYGMATVAKNLARRPGLAAGQEIVLVHEEFPSDVYAWEEVCAEKGLTIKTVSPPDTLPGRGEAWNERLLNAIGPSTCLVVAPAVHWADGTRFDLKAIGRRAREVGAWLVVDGTQSVGALPFDAGEIAPDALICAGYKWLMGPYALGLAYFGEVFDEGMPLERNWINRVGSEDFRQLIRYQTDYRGKAGRYSVGEQSNFILMPMLEAALEQLLAWDAAVIQVYCRALINESLDRLRARGYWIEEESWRANHLFGVRLPPAVAMESVRENLADRRISVSVRGNVIRVSPHVYNEPRDLEALVEALGA